ncbi:hypothetical protein Bca4012_073861 [Brassica carinata]
MPPPHHRFKKQCRITEPTIYRNPPYHSGMTPEPRTSTVFIDLEDHRNLPGNLTPTTEEHLQRLYWRFLGFNSCNAHAGVSESFNQFKLRAHPNDFINQPHNLRFLTTNSNCD